MFNFSFWLFIASQKELRCKSMIPSYSLPILGEFTSLFLVQNWTLLILVASFQAVTPCAAREAQKRVRRCARLLRRGIKKRRLLLEHRKEREREKGDGERRSSTPTIPSSSSLQIVFGFGDGVPCIGNGGAHGRGRGFVSTIPVHHISFDATGSVYLGHGTGERPCWKNCGAQSLISVSPFFFFFFFFFFGFVSGCLYRFHMFAV